MLSSGMLDVGGGHRVYYEEHGSAKGKPVVVLHGGPGGGLERWLLGLFNLKKWRIVLFDQRGCGRSTPRLGLEHNTTWDLVADTERLRELMGIDSWWVFGGSWGSTLALAYASRHLDRVRGLILRGIYLAESWENRWIYEEGGASLLRPAGWRRFTEGVPKKASVFKTYRRRLMSARTRKSAAVRWSNWENSLSTLSQNHEAMPIKQAEEISVLEMHYFAHNCWLRPGELLAAARHIPRSVPVWIVQGAFDLVCPPAGADALKQAIPHADLQMTVAGHSAGETENRRALARILRSIR